jgi:Rhodanese-like domain
MQSVCKNPEIYLLINTLPDSEQGCLIVGTVNAAQEEKLINRYVQTTNKNIQIIIYGRNCNDETSEKKYQQLVSLGFTNVHIYSGGLFEWLMLQDIYGGDEFPTTTKQLDFLKYKPTQRLNVGLLTY